MKFMLIIWLIINGEISEPIKMGPYSSSDACHDAAELALSDRIGSRQGAGTAICVPMENDE